MGRLATLLAVIGGCQSARREPPHVAASSAAPANRDVTVTAQATFAPACLVIQPGQTVEWQTETAIPVNVTSAAEPIELYSPNLVAPLACDPAQPEKVCWRHTFTTAGCFEYYDSNSGEPGRTITDPYYGTTVSVGEPGNATRALVCVESGPSACAGLCCVTRFDCPTVPGKTFECVASRCTDTETGRGIPCPVPQ